jgi:hypothetical protein
VKVTYADRSQRYWEVREGRKWWSIAGKSSSFLVVNSQTRVINPSGPTGKRVIQAVLDYEAARREVPDAVTNKRGEPA